MCIPLNVELQVLKKYEDEFFNVVDPKLHLLRLKRKKVITEALISKIETADSEDAKYILFEHLLHNADVAALREYCKMAIAADGFPKMQNLGEKMLNELALEGMLLGQCGFICLCVCMTSSVCVHTWCVRVCYVNVAYVLTKIARAVNILYSITTVSPSYRSWPDSSAY